MRFVICLLSILLFVFTAPAYAQNMDEGLYDPVPSPDSALVRIVNFSGTEQTFTVDGKVLPSFKNETSSPYFVVPAGTAQEIKAPGDTGLTLSGSYKFEAGAYYTIAAMPGRLVLLGDMARQNKEKAVIALYNLSDVPSLCLATPGGKIKIIDQVTPETERVREINAMSLTMQLGDTCESTKPFELLADKNLSRAQIYSLFLFKDTAGAPRTLWVQNQIDTRF